VANDHEGRSFGGDTGEPGSTTAFCEYSHLRVEWKAWVRLGLAESTLLGPERTSPPVGERVAFSSDHIFFRKLPSRVLRGARCVCEVAGVGWLFVEMCIVDASIFVTR
jgi:hypothetical protein